MAIVLYTPLFKTVADGIGVPEVEFYAVLEYYSSKPKEGTRIVGAGGAKQHEVLGFCVITYYSRRFDAVLLIDLYKRNCAHDWPFADTDVFSKIIKRFSSIRKRHDQ